MPSDREWTSRRCSHLLRPLNTSLAGFCKATPIHQASNITQTVPKHKPETNMKALQSRSSNIPPTATSLEDSPEWARDKKRKLSFETRDIRTYQQRKKPRLGTLPSNLVSPCVKTDCALGSAHAAPAETKTRRAQFTMASPGAKRISSLKAVVTAVKQVLQTTAGTIPPEQESSSVPSLLSMSLRAIPQLVMQMRIAIKRERDSGHEIELLEPDVEMTTLLEELPIATPKSFMLSTTSRAMALWQLRQAISNEACRAATASKSSTGGRIHVSTSMVRAAMDFLDTKRWPLLFAALSAHLETREYQALLSAWEHGVEMLADKIRRLASTSNFGANKLLDQQVNRAFMHLYTSDHVRQNERRSSHRGDGADPQWERLRDFFQYSAELNNVELSPDKSSMQSVVKIANDSCLPTPYVRTQLTHLRWTEVDELG